MAEYLELAQKPVKHDNFVDEWDGYSSDEEYYYDAASEQDERDSYLSDEEYAQGFDAGFEDALWYGCPRLKELYLAHSGYDDGYFYGEMEAHKVACLDDAGTEQEFSSSDDNYDEDDSSQISNGPSSLRLDVDLDGDEEDSTPRAIKFFNAQNEPNFNTEELIKDYFRHQANEGAEGQEPDDFTDDFADGYELVRDSRNIKAR